MARCQRLGGQSPGGGGAGRPANPPPLQLALQEHRAHVCLGPARALWKLQAPPEEVLPVLTALLHHPLASLRKGALEGLAAMGKAAAPSQAEVEPLLDDEHATVREAARLAWKRITGKAPAAGRSGSAGASPAAAR